VSLHWSNTTCNWRRDAGTMYRLRRLWPLV